MAPVVNEASNSALERRPMDGFKEIGVGPQGIGGAYVFWVIGGGHDDDGRAAHMLGGLLTEPLKEFEAIDKREAKVKQNGAWHGITLPIRKVAMSKHVINSFLAVSGEADRGISSGLEGLENEQDVALVVFDQQKANISVGHEE